MSGTDNLIHTLHDEMAKKKPWLLSHLNIRKEHYKYIKMDSISQSYCVNCVKYMHFMKLFKFHKIFMICR